MNHLPFIAGAYAIGILLPIAFAIDAALRVRAARRRLAAIDPRQRGSYQRDSHRRPHAA
jgi:hypothetical protein